MDYFRDVIPNHLEIMKVTDIRSVNDGTFPLQKHLPKFPGGCLCQVMPAAGVQF